MNAPPVLEEPPLEIIPGNGIEVLRTKRSHIWGRHSAREKRGTIGWADFIIRGLTTSYPYRWEHKKWSLYLKAEQSKKPFEHLLQKNFPSLAHVTE